MSGLVQEAEPWMFCLGQKRGSVRKYKVILLTGPFLHLSEVCSTKGREYLSSSGFIGQHPLAASVSHWLLIYSPGWVRMAPFTFAKPTFYFSPGELTALTRFSSCVVGKSPFQHFLPPLHIEQHCWGGGALKPLPDQGVNLNYSQYLDVSTLKPMEKSGN